MFDNLQHGRRLHDLQHVLLVSVVSRVRLLSTVAVLAAVAGSTQGCALLLTGYLVGDAMQRSKRVDECRANLKIQNDQRIRDGKDAYPDMCGQ